MARQRHSGGGGPRAHLRLGHERGELDGLPVHGRARLQRQPLGLGHEQGGDDACADLKNDDGSDFAVSGGFYTCARIEMHAPELCARTKGTGEAETLPSEMCCFCGGGAIA